MKKSAQRICKHCTLAVVRRSQNIFTLPQTPFLGAQDGQSLISWRWSLPLHINPVQWGSMHAISSYRGNRPTNTPTNTQTNPQTGPITIHCAAASLVRSVMIREIAKRETVHASIDKHGKLEIDAIPRPQSMEVSEWRCNIPSNEYFWSNI